MPEMSGYKLVKHVRTIDWEVKILLMTVQPMGLMNYFEQFNKMFPTFNVDAVVRKPFNPSELAEVIYKNDDKVFV